MTSFLQDAAVNGFHATLLATGGFRALAGKGSNICCTGVSAVPPPPPPNPPLTFELPKRCGGKTLNETVSRHQTRRGGAAAAEWEAGEGEIKQRRRTSEPNRNEERAHSPIYAYEKIYTHCMHIYVYVQHVVSFFSVKCTIIFSNRTEGKCRDSILRFSHPVWKLLPQCLIPHTHCLAT